VVQATWTWTRHPCKWIVGGSGVKIIIRGYVNSQGLIAVPRLKWRKDLAGALKKEHCLLVEMKARLMQQSMQLHVEHSFIRSLMADQSWTATFDDDGIE
jgi:hypothetical protein